MHAIRRLLTALGGRLPLFLLLASLTLAFTGCPDNEPTGGEDAGKVGGKDAAKPGLDAEEEIPPDATIVVGQDAAAPGQDAGTPGQDAATPGQDASTTTTNVYWLTLLHSSDTESAMLPSDSYGGVAYFTTLVKNLKTQAAAWQPTAQAGEVVKTGTMMVSAGDNMLPGLSFKTSLDHGVPFYETLAMQVIGYQAVALGNHDFDYGPSKTADLIKGFNPAVKFVSANLDVSAEATLQAQATAGNLVKSLVVDTGNFQVGVIADITPELPYLTMMGSVTVSAVSAAVQAEVTKLTTAGVDKIVLLSHMQAVANDKLLVPQLHGVDIVVSGGGHEVQNNAGVTVVIPGEKTSGTYPEWVADADGVQVPIVAAGSLYRYVGRLVAKFDATGKLAGIDTALSTPVRVVNTASTGVTDVVTADSTVDSTVVTPIKNATNALKANVVAVSAVPLNGYRTDVRTQETNEGDLCADAMLWQGQALAAAAGVTSPTIGLINGGGIRNNSVIPAGNITEYDTYAMLPFSNRVAIVPAATRDTLKALLENAVSKVSAVDGRFLQVSGLKFAWDGSKPARALDASGAVTNPGSRIVTVTLDDGTPIVTAGSVVSGGTLSIATIDFEAAGGDQSPYPKPYTFTILNATYQEALKNYLQSGLSGQVTAAKYPVAGTGRITAANACGNGVVESVVTETCDDGNARAGDGCSDKCVIEAGYTCTGAPSVCTKGCGNGTIETGEDCDGTNLGTPAATCLTVPGGFTGGTLLCNATTCKFDTSTCLGGGPVCGNTVIETGEDCDGTNLGSATCLTVPGGFTGGTLACSGTTCKFNTAGCTTGSGLTDLAVFTFESMAATGVTAGPYNAETGSGTIVGSHANAQAVYAVFAGNGSAQAYSANYWSIGDYFQVQVSGTGATGLQITWDQTRSGTGPTAFQVQWSTDGTTFQDVGAAQTIAQVGWNSTTPVTTSTYGPIALPSGANGAAAVYIRIGATVAGTSTAGTSRIDNVKVSGVK